MQAGNSESSPLFFDAMLKRYAVDRDRKNNGRLVIEGEVKTGSFADEKCQKTTMKCQITAGERIKKMADSCER